MAYTIIDNEDSFQKMLSHLSTQKIISLDTESDTFYHYHERLCLVQISTFANSDDEGEIVNYIIDVIKFTNIADLNAVLANPDILKIIHSSINDIVALYKRYKSRFKNIFDTQIAAELLNYGDQNLYKILEKKFDYELVDKKRMKRSDWTRRPLSDAQLDYASKDSQYLISLWQLQDKELKEKGIQKEALKRFIHMETFAIQSFNNSRKTRRPHIKGTDNLDDSQKNLLTNLLRLREDVAKKRNLAPFRVMNSETLISLITNQPILLSELKSIPGFNDEMIDSFGIDLVDIIWNHTYANRKRIE